jgi:hypothetical protein
MKQMWRRIVSTIAGAFVRTPVEVVIAIATAVALSATIEDWIEPETFAQFAMAAFLAVAATFAASSLHALHVFGRRTRWVLTAAFGVAIVGYGGWWLDVDLTTELWRFGFLAVAAVMGVALTPVAARLGDATASERFWRFNTRLLFRVTIAAVYAGLLFAGVALGVLAVDELFDLHVSGDVYGHLFALIGVALGPILAVGSLGDVSRIDRPYSDGEMVWFGRLGTFLFIPLLLFYVGILYLYLGKVMLTGDVPSNLLSPLALGAGILGYAGIFALQPFLKRDDHRPLAFVLKAFPAAFIPLVPLGIWAVAERIGQYGWTEFRYARIAALVCLGVFSLVGTWRWVRGRDFSLTFGPAIVGLVAFAGAVGPWGASYVSYSSQRARLVESLGAQGLIDGDGRIAGADKVRAVDPLELNEAREAADYLMTAHGADAFDGLAPTDLDEYDVAYDALHALGLETMARQRYVSLNTAGDATFRFERGGEFSDFSVGRTWVGQRGVANLSVDGDALVATVDGDRAETSMEPLATLADSKTNYAEIPERLRHWTLTTEDGTAVGEIVLRSAQLQEVRSGEWEIDQATGFVNVW